MATGAVANAQNLSHGGVAGGLWWLRAPDLTGWEGAVVRGELGLCFVVAGFAERRLNRPSPVAQRGAL